MGAFCGGGREIANHCEYDRGLCAKLGHTRPKLFTASKGGRMDAVDESLTVALLISRLFQAGTNEWTGMAALISWPFWVVSVGIMSWAGQP
jgi:hypothetical protein